MRPDLLLLRGLAVVLALVVGSNAAMAAPAWKDLSAEQRQLIAPALVSQGGDFDKLSEPRRTALAKGAERWLAMSPAQRTNATQQFQRWQQMDKDQKLAVLEQRERFRKMTPAQRRALLDTQRRFEQLTLLQQQDLRSEFSELLPRLVDELAVQSVTAPTAPSAPSPGPVGLPSGSLANGFNLPVLPH